MRPVLTPTNVSWAWGPYQNDQTRPSRSLKRTHLKANTRSLPRVNFHGWPQTMARSHTPAAPQTATTYSQKAGRKTLKLKYTGAMQVAVTLCSKWKRGKARKCTQQNHGLKTLATRWIQSQLSRATHTQIIFWRKFRKKREWRHSFKWTDLRKVIIRWWLW